MILVPLDPQYVNWAISSDGDRPFKKKKDLSSIRFISLVSNGLEVLSRVLQFGLKILILMSLRN